MSRLGVRLQNVRRVDDRSSKGGAFNIVWLALLLHGCAAGVTRVSNAPPTPHTTPRAPYTTSRSLEATWDFSNVESQRQAHGSDLWPCAWRIDDDLYCAWGDGGGFDGDSDTVGRVSLGFARVSGTPQRANPSGVSGHNLWGSPPYALNAATFGGKVGSIISVDGRLYAHGGFWTLDDTPDPVHHSGHGPRNSIAWSDDAGISWQLAPWSSTAPLGSFLDEGRDTASTEPRVVLLYFQRPDDSQHLYLRRVASQHLTDDPSLSESDYFAGRSWWSGRPRWSRRATDAVPVFADSNHVQGASVVFDRPLGVYLLTAGHYASGNDDDSSAGQVGLFEAAHPWGPWHTVGYYETWGGEAMNRDTRGDFLSLRLPSKWISADGRTLWGIFSGLRSYDSFNLVELELAIH